MWLVWWCSRDCRTPPSLGWTVYGIAAIKPEAVYFTEQHGTVTFTGFVTPPTATELAGYLMTSSGERFIIRIRTEEVSPYRMQLFRVEPAPR